MIFTSHVKCDAFQEFNFDERLQITVGMRCIDESISFKVNRLNFEGQTWK